MSKTKQQLIDEAVRDLSSVSVTAAPKSKVRRIVEDFEQEVREDERRRIQKISDSVFPWDEYDAINDILDYINQPNK